MKASATIYVERNDEEIELLIVGTGEPFVPARTTGNPDNWSPPEGGGVEIEKILLDGQPWTGELTENEQEDAEQKLAEAFEEEMASCYEDRADAYADAHEDDQ